MARSRNLALGLGLWGCLAAVSVAEEALQLPAGTPVRLKAPQISSHRLTGTLAGASEREIVVALSSGERKTIPRRSVTRLEWSPGYRRHPIAGLVVGGLVCGAALAVLSAGLCDAADCSGAAPKGFLIGAGLGVLPGAGIGALVRTRVWTEAPVANLQLSAAPTRGGGVAVRVALAF